MASLKIIDGPGQGEEITLGERAGLGRWRQSALQIRDVSSSRNHAEVFFRDGGYVIKDLGSSNGTFVNEARVTEQPLHHGDRIRIGSVVVEFLGDPGASEPPAAADAAEPEAAEPVATEPEAPAKAEEADDAELVPAEEPVADGPPLDVPGLTILREIDADSASRTFLAFDPAVDRQVAVDVVRPACCPDPAAALVRVQTAARLEHPALAHIYSAGRTGSTVYVVRERAAGRTMWELAGKLQPAESAEIIQKAAAALAEAHDAGIVHGSIRPDRIVRTERGHAKVAGLGLPAAKTGTLSAEPDPPNRPSRIAYMAPEQLAGAPPTPASDIYSLGAVLYQLICGRTPFVGGSEAELAPRIVSENFEPVLGLRPDTPKAVAGILESMLARAPSSRPASMREVVQELRGVLEGPPMAVRPNAVTAARVEEPKGLTASTIIILILSAMLLASVFLLGHTAAGWFIRQSTEPAKTTSRPGTAFLRHGLPFDVAQGGDARVAIAWETVQRTPMTSIPAARSRAAATPIPGQV